MANEAIPFFEDADELTVVATAAITGKTLVQITAAKEGSYTAGLDATASGGRYKAGPPSASGALGAGKRVLGVASWDAAIGASVTVHRCGIFPVTCAANITAGVEVEVNAAGQVIPLNTGKAVGLCMTTVLSGADAEILLYQGGGA